MALQIQMNTIDEAGTATPMYPINRTSDVIVGVFAAAADASLPGESESETLDASLSLIKAYLQKMKTAAYMNIAEELGNDTESVPTTAMVYDAVKDVKTALQTTGGEMTGFLSFARQSNSTGATAGLKFKCLTGSPGGQSDSTYEIRAISYSTPGGGGSLYGAIGSNTLVPLNSDDSLGLNTKKWDTLHVSTICGFSLFGNMLPSEDGTRDIGSSTLRFKTGYFNKLSFKNSTYDESIIETYAEQYDRYGWRTGLSINTSIVPNNDGGGLCKLGDYSNRWYSLYTSSIYLCPMDSSITSCFTLSYHYNLPIHYDSTSNTNSDKSGIRMGDSSNAMSIQLYALDIYTSAYFTTNRDFSIYSDEKVKKQTNDLSDDIDKLNASLSDINIQSYIYRYNSNQSKQSIGVIAQELENVFISHGIDPFKYGILNVEYNAYINRGSEEDQKYYPKFMTISYEQLNTLALIKMQSLEKKNNELESRLAAIEARLG